MQKKFQVDRSPDLPRARQEKSASNLVARHHELPHGGNCEDDMCCKKSAPLPPAPIDDLETTLQRIRAMCANHCEQEALAHTATTCSTAAARSQYTQQEHPGLEACSRDLDEPCENTERPARERVRRSSLKHASNEERERRWTLRSPTLAVSWCTNIESVCIIPAREHESASLLWFDAAAVTAAAASGSRLDVKAAMEKSIRQYRNTW